MKTHDDVFYFLTPKCECSLILNRHISWFVRRFIGSLAETFKYDAATGTCGETKLNQLIAKSQGSFAKLWPDHFFRESVLKGAQKWGLKDPPDFSVSVYHTQTTRVKGQSILRRYWRGPSGQSKFFKPPPQTMATTGRQKLSSDNKQIKQSAYKRFIASHYKGRPRSSLRQGLWGPPSLVNSTWSSHFFSWGPLYHSKASTIKILMK